MAHEPLECRCGDTPGLAELIRAHPGLKLEPGTAPVALEFRQGGRQREITVGVGGGLFGLIECMDNNPLVCAEQVRVPDPASTLALIALSPLIQAGLLSGPPSIHGACPGSAAELAESLTAAGHVAGAVVNLSDGPQPVAYIEAITAVTAGSDEVVALYDEAFGRSFFVRRDQASEWTPVLVEGRNFAVYRIEPADTSRKLRIRVMSDKRGKCGAAQIVHTLNVMAGFEETLGLA